MKTCGKYLRKFLIILFFPAFIYFVLTLVGGLIPVNQYSENKENIQIYLVQNGSHTDILVPVTNEIIDWKKVIPPGHFSKAMSNTKYYSFGWGDREFYRTTPYWEDLTINTAFKALFLNTASAIHIKQIDEITAENMVEMNISAKEYKKLTEYFLLHLNFKKEKKLSPLDFHYSENDVFYESVSTFHAFRTCNSWTNSALKYSGLRSCLWTAFAFPLFWHYS